MRVAAGFGALTRGNPSILTIGAFDGMHRGHQYLIRQVTDRARRLDYDSVVVTFDPRPVVVLRPGSTQLSGAEEKLRIVTALAPSTVVVLPFSRELSHVPAGQFMVNLLEHVNLTEIWIGADFAFGHNREGNVDFLIRSGQQSGFAVHVVPRKGLDGTPISSTVVRTALDEGDVKGAARLLGHYFRVPGTVVRGAGRGAGMGFPTANLAVAGSQHVPAIGIYAAYAVLDRERIPAAVSVGTNPTFGENAMTIEPYLLDFDGNLTGRELALEFVDRIRDEARFESNEELIAQIEDDVAQTRRILEESQEPGELILSS